MSGERKRVLVIDDDPEVRGLIQSALESEGFDVAAAADGREGIALQRSNPADVVVTDIFMPGKEGIETVADLRREFPRTRIVVMSGGARVLPADTDYGDIALRLGASRALAKPFRPQELIAVVRDLAEV